MNSVPLRKSLRSAVLAASRERADATRSRRTGTASIVLATRAEKRRVRFNVGCSARKLAGARWIVAEIQFNATCVLNSCDATMATTRKHGCAGDRHCMGSTAYGVRAERYGPVSAAPDSSGVTMKSSDHWSTHSSGSGFKPARKARANSAAPSGWLTMCRWAPWSRTSLSPRVTGRPTCRGRDR